MPTFTLHEPAPHHPPTLGFGRGGAGNRTTSKPTPPTTLSSNTNTTKPSSTHSTSSAAQSRPYHTGRGGAGNARPSTDERRLFSFDEELARDEAFRGRLASEASSSHHGHSSGRVPVYHIGRGGQGNAVVVCAEGSERGRRGSGSSDGSERKGVSGWVKGLSRRG